MASLKALQEKIAKYRKEAWSASYNPNITCITLSELFFLETNSRFHAPAFAPNIVSGKTYSTDDPNSDLIIDSVTKILLQGTAKTSDLLSDDGSALRNMIASSGHRKPISILPRLGQGSFRTMVIKAYERACSLTNDHTLPVLEAAHVKPFSIMQSHNLDNGILLRSDLHKLFDQGFITISPQERKHDVSSNLRDIYNNGRIYYAMEGNVLREPKPAHYRIAEENLRYHAENVFKP